LRKSIRRNVFAPALACAAVACAALAQPGGINTYGKVALADGREPPEKAAIELVCQGQAQPQGMTDAKGDFNLLLGYERFRSASDASVSSAAGLKGALSQQTQAEGGSVMSLMGCFLRASLSGYRSETFDLSRVHFGEPVNAGIIVLRDLSKARGTTVSATSLNAPKNAKQAFDKAREHAANRQFAEAEKELKRAVQLYAKYAEAWLELGGVLQSQNRNAEARQAWLESIACDARYPKPYLSLARLSATERNWKDALEKSAAVLQLDPDGYPQAYYYSAVAQYNLDDYDKAIANARQAVRLDASHSVPLAEQLLGVLYSMKGDYKSAAEEYRNYLQHVPAGTNVDAVKTRLAEAEAHLVQTDKK
jgi:tetratricopeptide (TPR) repeat protein